MLEQFGHLDRFQFQFYQEFSWLGLIYLKKICAFSCSDVRHRFLRSKTCG